MRITLYILLLAFSGSLYAQSVDRNYIQSRTYMKADSSLYMDKIQYLDGLGRPVQTVQQGITPSNNDLVSLQEYDDFGRESNIWLPGTSSANGRFVDPQDLKQSILNSALYTKDQKPYSNPVYENSPLNRILE